MSVRYGLLGGVVVVFYFVLLYMARKALFLNAGLQWASLLLYAFFMFRALQADSAAHGRNRPFPLMVRTPFMVFLLINLCYWLFYYSINLADPELLKMQTEAQMAFLQEQLAAGTGDPQQSNALREQIAYLEHNGMSMPLGPVVLQMGMGALGGFALSAAMVAVYRENPKVEIEN